MEMMKLFMRDVGNLKIAVMKKEACGQGKGVTKSLLPEYGTKLGDQIKFKLEDGKTPAPRAEVKLIDHKFLTQKVEGEMEFLATFHSADRPLNESILYRVLGVGEDEIPAHLEQTEGHVAILASVGSSSTQIFTLKEVIGGLLIGTDQILENPRVAELFLSEIIDVVRKKEIMAPLILMGSIGQSVEMTTDLKELKWDTNYKEVARKGNRDYEKWLHTLPALGFACRDSGWEDRCIMQERQIEEDKLKSKWLPVMAESLWNDYCSRSDYDPEVTGIYVTDYGGSGPNLFYYDSLKHKMSSVARDVGLLRGKQPVFVTEMMRGKEEESEGFRKSVDFFEKNISEHAEKNGIRKIVLYIRQTGMIRQQFFLHTLEPKIVFDTFESDGWERFEKKRSVK